MNLSLSSGGLLAVRVFLIVSSAATSKHSTTLWQVCLGMACLMPLTVFLLSAFKMLKSKLDRRGVIVRSIPCALLLRYYSEPLNGTCGD